MILKISVRSTQKELGCKLSRSFDINEDSEEGAVLFLQLAVMFKIQKKNENKRKHQVPEFFRKQEEKRIFNNLGRNETRR